MTLFVLGTADIEVDLGRLIGVQPVECNEELPTLGKDEGEEEDEDRSALIQVNDSDEEKDEDEFTPVLTFTFDLIGGPEDEEERQDCTVGTPVWERQTEARC